MDDITQQMNTPGVSYPGTTRPTGVKWSAGWQKLAEPWKGVRVPRILNLGRSHLKLQKHFLGVIAQLLLKYGLNWSILKTVSLSSLFQEVFHFPEDVLLLKRSMSF